MYDSDWNPQNDIQAISRAHRIGQNKPVMVYILFTKNTVEEELLKRARSKLALEHIILENLEKKEIESILKCGAKDIVSDDPFFEINYGEKEVEDLLDRDKMIKENHKENDKEGKSDNIFGWDFTFHKIWEYEKVLNNNSTNNSNIITSSSLVNSSDININIESNSNNFFSNTLNNTNNEFSNGNSNNGVDVLLDKFLPSVIEDLKEDDTDFWEKLLKDKVKQRTEEKDREKLNFGVGKRAKKINYEPYKDSESLSSENDEESSYELFHEEHSHQEDDKDVQFIFFESPKHQKREKKRANDRYIPKKKNVLQKLAKNATFSSSVTSSIPSSSVSSTLPPSSLNPTFTSLPPPLSSHFDSTLFFSNLSSESYNPSLSRLGSFNFNNNFIYNNNNNNLSQNLSLDPNDTSLFNSFDPFNNNSQFLSVSPSDLNNNTFNDSAIQLDSSLNSIELLSEQPDLSFSAPVLINQIDNPSSFLDSSSPSLSEYYNERKRHLSSELKNLIDHNSHRILHYKSHIPSHRQINFAYPSFYQYSDYVQHLDNEITKRRRLIQQRAVPPNPIQHIIQFDPSESKN